MYVCTFINYCSYQIFGVNVCAYNYFLRFVVQPTVINGGYLDIYNFDTFSDYRHYYTGTPIAGSTTFILDFEPPVHCSLTPATPCIVGQSLLNAGEGITDSTEIEISWGGWIDEPAGVVSYTLDVYQMTESNMTLRETMLVASLSFNHTGQTEYRHMMNVSEGAFSVVLRVLDLAQNVRYSRRLFLNDRTSQLLVDNTTDLRVDSAVPETGFLWQNSTATPVVVSGRGHFYNTHLRIQDLLAPVANFSPPIATEYDHPLEDGNYPRGGVSNALGVTELYYEVAIDREGGRAEESLEEPRIFGQSTTNLELDGVVIELDDELQDGDSVRIWFLALDYVFHTAVDSVLFHVDSSTPELDSLWLEWNGVTGLALHGTKSLLDLTIQFQTSDPHSGVSEILYWVGTNPESFDVAYGELPVQTVEYENCSAPDCICDILNSHCSRVQYSFSPPASDFVAGYEAVHDTEYHIMIVVTNHAFLTSFITHTFTTDTTPPLTGVVMDAKLGSHDLDYVANSTLSAWWADFFDRETSILLFQYHFGTECANSTVFTYPLSDGSTDIHETLQTTTTWTAPSIRTYYVTVVAYNSALQPSKPACSDGITIDQTPPVIEEITVPNTVESPDLTYITADYHLNVSWTASDNVGIRGYHIAAVSQEAYLRGEESVNYTSTANRPHFSFHSPDLFSNGKTFYLLLMASDFAGHQTEKVAGPFKIDISPPVIGGNITLWKYDDQGHVIVTWQNDTFTDEESGVVSLEYSIGIYI